MHLPVVLEIWQWKFRNERFYSLDLHQKTEKTFANVKYLLLSVDMLTSIRARPMFAEKEDSYELWKILPDMCPFSYIEGS